MLVLVSLNLSFKLDHVHVPTYCAPSAARQLYPAYIPEIPFCLQLKYLKMVITCLPKITRTNNVRNDV